MWGAWSLHIVTITQVVDIDVSDQLASRCRQLHRFLEAIGVRRGGGQAERCETKKYHVFLRPLKARCTATPEVYHQFRWSASHVSVLAFLCAVVQAPPILHVKCEVDHLRSSYLVSLLLRPPTPSRTGHSGLILHPVCL